MKNLFIGLVTLMTGTISAQTLQEHNVHIQMPATETSLSNGKYNSNKSQSCGLDTIEYAGAKASDLTGINLNVFTSAGAVGQYFDAPQELTISGVSFYAWKPDATGGIFMNCSVGIYSAAADSTPITTDDPLASEIVTIDTTFAGGSLDGLKKEVIFGSPITVSDPYVVVISNETNTNMAVVFNDYVASDGAQEWLASAFIVPLGWTRPYNVALGESNLDADVLIEPYVSYNLSASYLIDDPCFSEGLALNFTNTSSPVAFNRMYNEAVYMGLPELSFTWDYGDGAPAENLVDASHTYEEASSYLVSLTDTIFGWTTTCASDTVVTIGAAPVAAFTSVEAGLTSTFTNGSTVSSEATYSWDFGDGNMSDAMNPTHTFAENGTYTVTLTVTDDCGSDEFTNDVTVGVTGIEELSATDIVVYPNPSKGFFSVKASAEMKSVFITDLTGKVVYTRRLSGNEASFDTGYLDNGSYVLSIHFADGMNQMDRLEIVK